MLAAAAQPGRPWTRPSLALEHHHLPVRQPANVVNHFVPGGLGLVEVGEFVHDEGGFAGFGVGDVDGEVFAGVDVVEFVGQHFGAEVAAAVGQVALAVAKRRFDDQHANVDLVDAPPKGGVALSVTGENPVRGGLGGQRGAAQGVAAGGHGVHGGQYLNAFAAQLQHLADLDGFKAQKGLLGAGQL